MNYYYNSLQSTKFQSPLSYPRAYTTAPAYPTYKKDWGLAMTGLIFSFLNLIVQGVVIYFIIGESFKNIAVSQWLILILNVIGLINCIIGAVVDLGGSSIYLKLKVYLLVSTILFGFMIIPVIGWTIYELNQPDTDIMVAIIGFALVLYCVVQASVTMCPYSAFTRVSIAIYVQRPINIPQQVMVASQV